MPRQLAHLRLVAVNIDGVLLNDSFSPVMRRLVEGYGATYDARFEREMLSQPQRVAAQRAADRLGGDAGQLIKEYFALREEYIREHPVHLLDGAAELLATLREFDVRTVCYGGLERAHFDRHLGEFADYFDAPGYVCTNDFRPGIREISELFGLRHDQALFIDDVARVAGTARELGTPFIGHPGESSHGYQRQLMEEAGVRHMVGTLRAIDAPLLRTVDAEAAAGTVWD
ncbi:HAD family hydrolase [Streptomyces cavernicola]|uniref:HAD family phosphatase n=1 Tax=Streptomyces cavernicola TaxID=3043613 RepID=A0ABT6SK06_9ACTN|nr:HAD family phosphatase [Streptomyces sp. B-S-A6]MDI3408229.1 HAD family phosphatase [Streptomyces sp. B-S-A6]